MLLPCTTYLRFSGNHYICKVSLRHYRYASNFVLPAVIAGKSPTIAAKWPVTINAVSNASHINVNNFPVNGHCMPVSAGSRSAPAPGQFAVNCR